MPVAYSEAIVSEILIRLADGEHLSDIIRSDPARFPNYSTVFRWGEEGELREEIARARREGYLRRAEQLRHVAADESIEPASRKLQLDTERWFLSKMHPERFGDRTALQMLDEHGKPAKAGITIIVDGAPGE